MCAMPRRMSCSMTIPQVLAKTKTETRRAPGTWVSTKPKDTLTLIDKCMGLKKGEKQKILATVIVAANYVEPILNIDEAAVTREGFNCDPLEFAVFWAFAHGHGPRLRANGITAHEFSEPPDTCRAKAIRRALQNVNCRVIRWSYSENKP